MSKFVETAEKSRHGGRVPRSDSPHFWFLLWLAIAVSCASVYLMTWRVALRFGARGLVLFALAAAPIGPPHDYQIVVIFPRWVTFSPGIVPVLGVATFFAVLVIVGHIVKGVVFRHARADSFCAVVPGRRREQRATRMYGPTRLLRKCIRPYLEHELLATMECGAPSSCLDSYWGPDENFVLVNGN